MDLWHQRLGHPMVRTVKAIVVAHSLPVLNKCLDFCRSCNVSKSHRLPFSYRSTIYNSPLDLIISAIWGLAPIISNNGFRYYILFMDAFSRYTWIFSIAHRSDALTAFISFKNTIEQLFDHKIKTFQLTMGAST